ncbi:hypothetical protein RE628_27895 [Paenibacillus sp. D2_2]|uniref:hypothetical protein n=1 Tax=Paenibacillus sp. D2_2 TaxID=3073092 RepID=UPI002815347C|nr:hypothetical protein [Paenibacillus sp. D2_2]WMT40864.1 hypothetical protein RE628_27895 [Paenibacillus sp. D2_2]
MKMNWRKIVSFTVASALLATIVTGCGSKAGKSDTGSGKDSKDRLKISMMYPLSGDAPKKGEAWKWLEDKFNVELDLMAIPANGYTEKLRLTVASGELPDMMV